jgi:hypothetical protein
MKSQTNQWIVIFKRSRRKQKEVTRSTLASGDLIHGMLPETRMPKRDRWGGGGRC